mmetsp:Transcript_8124/g.10150  ORF Transcript_8124/g.10150 Transcript_8124/m.10150 type:complete len:325 (+) Transcript_8124:258-1232(+)
MTKGPDDYIFDGHIDPIQTKTMSLFSKLSGVEPHGGERTIFTMMENIVDSPAPSTGTETIFFWEAGGVGSIANEICKCFPINMATTFGNEEVGDPRVLEPHVMDGNLCGLYNVNLGTHAGTRRAKDLGLITNVVPDFISSPFLPEIASLFTPERKGRIILVVPNTAVRIRFSYDHLKRKGLFSGSMLEFVSSDHILANNYLTHILSGKWGGGVEELTEEDFAVAVSVLKTKMIVATWADNRRMVDFITRNQQWDQSGLNCMYPPTNPYSIEQAQKAKTEPRPPPPEKTPEEIATETAVRLHNYYDDRLFTILAQQAQEQAASIL